MIVTYWEVSGAEVTEVMDREKLQKPIAARL
jgi:hypothetical protein